jgi:MFS family permease
MLNRFGASVPPLLFSRRLKVMQRKKWGLVTCTSGMSLFFLILAAMWLPEGDTKYSWMPAAFLVLYALFFIFSGVNQLAFGTLQGKLIRTVWRGRLMLLANVTGSVSAILCALWLLPKWLRPDGGDFHWVFGFSGLCFGVAAATGTLLREPADDFRDSRRGMLSHFRGAGSLLRRDRHLRRVALVAALFGTSLVLFPHYQALGRDRLSLTLDHLMWWVIVQNLGTGLFSLLVGPSADWHGNRRVLRMVLLGTSVAPLLAITLSHAGIEGGQWYWLVFVLLGLTPITIRTLNNYTLEICRAEEHPSYLSTLGLCLSVPILFSPFVGMAVDLAGFDVVFLAIAGLVFLGWLKTWRMHEPRQHHRRSTEAISGGK